MQFGLEGVEPIMPGDKEESYLSFPSDEVGFVSKNALGGYLATE